MPEARLNENLQRLLAELESYATAEPRCQSRRAAPDPAARLIAERMPLAHSLPSRAMREVAESDALRSQQRLGRTRAGSAEDTLGTENAVFFFAGPFRFQPTSCGFLFRAEVEVECQDRSIAAPFDSGGLIGHFRRADPSEPPRDFLRRHELPVPHYRTYFEQTLACLFESPWNYLDGTEPDAASPVHLDGGDARRFTFEVRVNAELSVPAQLLAVFLPAEIAAERRVAQALARWQVPSESVRIFVVDWAGSIGDERLAWPGLEAACAEFLDAHLERLDE